MKKITPRHTIFKLLKASGKERLLNAIREKSSCNQEKQYKQQLTSYQKQWRPEDNGTTYLKY